ncbi:hypothetical protein VP01_969g3 [Puccinia sorghi]|uniref:Uncharacterized protein n=1 Tax=Puccinia sorghi TaxID=27349 RepID=A0A0L6U6I8_9BASI|nr:hypothetical protein VP01_969g3 [Puccinia sorghi]
MDSNPVTPATIIRPSQVSWLGHVQTTWRAASENENGLIRLMGFVLYSIPISLFDLRKRWVEVGILSDDDHSACLSSRLIMLRMVLNFQRENSTLRKTQETRASGSERSIYYINIFLANQHEDSCMRGRAMRSCPVREASSKELCHHTSLGLRVDVSALAETAPAHILRWQKRWIRREKRWMRREKKIDRKQCLKVSRDSKANLKERSVEEGKRKRGAGGGRWRVEDTGVVKYQSKSWDGIVGYNKISAVESMELCVMLVTGRPWCLRRVAQQFKQSTKESWIKFSARIELLEGHGERRLSARRPIDFSVVPLIFPLCRCSKVHRKEVLNKHSPSAEPIQASPRWLHAGRMHHGYSLSFLLRAGIPRCLNPCSSENRLPVFFDHQSLEVHFFSSQSQPPPLPRPHSPHRKQKTHS